MHTRAFACEELHDEAAGPIVFAIAVAVSTAAAAAPPADKARRKRRRISRPQRAAAEHVAGFFDVYRDIAKGRVLLGVHALDTPFLLVTSLPWGLGSNDVGLDRGQSGESHLVEFRRAGPRLLLVEDNTKFRAVSSNADEALSVRQAFAESVLWAGDIVGERKGDDAEVVVDVGSLLTSDRHGIARRLADAKQGKYEIDDKRSAVSLADAKSFPDNTELEAMLTFKGPGDQQFVKDVAMDPRKPDDAPASEFRALAAGRDTRRVLIIRRRALSASASTTTRSRSRRASTCVSSRDSGSTRPIRPRRESAVKKPIVFYLDRGTPEPVRSALLEGANWWKTAFEKAGFKDAYRVELLPEGVDPMDIRYSIITWAHRYTRGWSYGQPIVDPRTGEIIKGTVTLGSQRVRQDILIAESLLAPYDKSNATELASEAQQMALARLRQLAAHEVGHALGFAHNFAASRLGNGSVMDYPHPLLKLDADGAIGLDHAYGVGVGPWDDFLVAHAYAQFPAGQEAASLAKLRADIAKAGFRYISDPDSRAPGDAGAGWLAVGFRSGHAEVVRCAARRAAQGARRISRSACCRRIVRPAKSKRGSCRSICCIATRPKRSRGSSAAPTMRIPKRSIARPERRWCRPRRNAPRSIGSSRRSAPSSSRCRRACSISSRRPATTTCAIASISRPRARRCSMRSARSKPRPRRRRSSCSRRSGSIVSHGSTRATQREPGVADVLDAVFRGTWQRDEIARRRAGRRRRADGGELGRARCAAQCARCGSAARASRCRRARVAAAVAEVAGEECGRAAVSARVARRRRRRSASILPIRSR